MINNSFCAFMESYIPSRPLKLDISEAVSRWRAADCVLPFYSQQTLFVQMI